MELEFDRKLVRKVIHREKIGIWVMDLKQGRESAMYLDEVGRHFFGAEDDFSPEELFRYWYDRIHENDSEQVLTALEQMKLGKAAEVSYLWRHPAQGLIQIRCSGTAAAAEGDDIRLEGCHQDVTQRAVIRRQNDSMLEKINLLETEGRENELVVESLNKIYFAVHHLNMISAQFYTFRIKDGVTNEVSQAGNIYEAMDALCEKCVMPEFYERMKVFTDLTNIRQRMAGSDRIAEEFISRFQGWIEVAFIVADRNAQGEITDLIMTGRRIDREKRKAQSLDDMLRALSSEYHSIYRINTETGECFGYRMSNAITGQFGNQFAVSVYADSIRTYKERVVLPEDWPLFEQLDTVEKMRTLLEGKKDITFPFRIMRNGQLHYCVARLIKGREDAVEYLFGFKDNDEMARAQKEQELSLRQALQKAEEAEKKMSRIAEEKSRAFCLIHETLDSGMWSMEFDELGNMSAVNWSREFCSMIGYTGENEFPATLEAWLSKVHPDDLEMVQKEYYDTMNDYTGDKTLDMEYRMQVKNGEWRWFHMAGRLARGKDGLPQSYSGLFVDITEKKYHMLRENNLEKQAFTDSLTGIGNRRAYEETIRQIEEQESIENLTLIAMDVDYLKRTNDTFGHAAGDELLCAAAACISDSFGFLGRCFRTGGDEFLVIIEKEIEDLTVLLEAFEENQKKWQGKLSSELSISYGYVMAKQQPFATVKRLLQVADNHMYEQKKQHHKNRSAE